MRQRFVIIALALSAGLLAACDRGPERADANRGATPPRADAPPTAPQANVRTTPAQTGAPKSLEEKKEGANPVQGQVDPKQREQHRDFRQSGDAAGPKASETQPRS